MPPAGFEPAIPASERPKTHALDRATLILLGRRQHRVDVSGRVTVNV